MTDKWRAKIDRYDLYFDQARLELLTLPCEFKDKVTVAEAINWWEKMNKGIVPGTPGGRCSGPPMLPNESLVDAYLRLFPADSTEANTFYGSEWGSIVAAFLSELLLLSPKTHLFVVDSKLATDVVGSRNDALTGEDLDLLPFPQTWVEFSEPIHFAHGKTNTLNVTAAGFWSSSGSPLRLVFLASDVMCKAGEVSSQYGGGQYRLTAKTRAGLFLLFWGRKRLLGTADEELAVHLGSGGDDTSEPYWQRMLLEASVASKNLYDFLTSRSFDYVVCNRPARDFSAIKRFRHLQGGAAKGLRDYRMVKVNKEVLRDRQAGPAPEWIGTESSVEVPGCFHRWVYCKACGDCHRHDLIGHPCRKCKLTVGPTANIKIERYWHPPYLRGSGPLRDHVRHLVS